MTGNYSATPAARDGDRLRSGRVYQLISFYDTEGTKDGEPPLIGSDQEGDPHGAQMQVKNELHGASCNLGSSAGPCRPRRTPAGHPRRVSSLGTGRTQASCRGRVGGSAVREGRGGGEGGLGEGVLRSGAERREASWGTGKGEGVKGVPKGGVVGARGMCHRGRGGARPANPSPPLRCPAITRTRPVMGTGLAPSFFKTLPNDVFPRRRKEKKKK